MEPVRKVPDSSYVPSVSTPEMVKSPAKIVATVIGAIFIGVGLLGFLFPNLLGMHLGLVHNLIHLVSGGLLLYFATKAESQLRTFCLGFGAVYGLLGVAGYLFGKPVSMEGERNLLTIIPEVLHFGSYDHGIHLTIGLALVAAGLWKRKASFGEPIV